MSNIIVKLIALSVAVLIGLVMAIAAGLLMSLPVMLLWNWLAPALFGLKEIEWLQAWGLLVLCGILFKSHSSSSS
jgi:hypothetical protein